MFYYTFAEAIVGIVLAIIIVKRAKKTEDITYGKLDKAGRIVNIVLAIAYAWATPLYLFIAILSVPDLSLGIFKSIAAIIVAILISSTSMVCSVGLGASVALRRKGKSRESFAIQFAGAAAIVLALVLFLLFYETLMVPLN